MTDETNKLQQLIDDSRRIVFFGGAGVSIPFPQLDVTLRKEA